MRTRFSGMPWLAIMMVLAGCAASTDLARLSEPGFPMHSSAAIAVPSSVATDDTAHPGTTWRGERDAVRSQVAIVALVVTVVFLLVLAVTLGTGGRGG